MDRQRHATLGSAEDRGLRSAVACRSSRIAGGPAAKALVYQLRARDAQETGRELIARAIHEEGPCRRAIFVLANCAMLGNELFESDAIQATGGSATEGEGKVVPPTVSGCPRTSSRRPTRSSSAPPAA